MNIQDKMSQCFSQPLSISIIWEIMDQSCKLDGVTLGLSDEIDALNEAIKQLK